MQPTGKYFQHVTNLISLIYKLLRNWKEKHCDPIKQKHKRFVQKIHGKNTISSAYYIPRCFSKCLID